MRQFLTATQASPQATKPQKQILFQYVFIVISPRQRQFVTPCCEFVAKLLKNIALDQVYALPIVQNVYKLRLEGEIRHHYPLCKAFYELN
jgi:hypothetical protein